MKNASDMDADSADFLKEMMEFARFVPSPGLDQPSGYIGLRYRMGTLFTKARRSYLHSFIVSIQSFRGGAAPSRNISPIQN
jgi:hypothetical protein